MNFDQALCKGRGKELPHPFFEGFELLAKKAQQKEIKKLQAFCNMCPIHEECFNYAQENRLWGVWGGSYFRAGKPLKTVTYERFADQDDLDRFASARYSRRKVASSVTT